MKVTTNNKQIALEVLSAQNLFSQQAITEITINGIGNHKYALNNYDAKVIVGDVEVVLFRDANFKNVKIEDILSDDFNKIEFVIVDNE